MIFEKKVIRINRNRRQSDYCIVLFETYFNIVELYKNTK